MSAKSQARIRNLSRRALYTLEAAKRVSDAVLKGKSVRDAVGSERPFFEAHKKRSKESLKVASRLDAYVAQHGRMATWIHGPKTPTDRPHHVAAHGKTFDILAGPPKATSSYPGEEPNCVPAGVVVSGPRAIAAVERWYEGEVVELRTDGGRQLSVTPNHPIATPDGWVPAGSLVEGDDVLCCSNGEGSSEFRAEFFDPDDYQEPALIEDVVGTLAELGYSLGSRPVSPEHFHGDGIGSKVYVIWTDSLLGRRFQAAFEQPPIKLPFKRRSVKLLLLTGFRALNSFCERHGATSHCVMRSISALASFFLAHLRSRELGGLGLIANGNSSFFQSLANSPAREVKLFRQSKLGVSGNVACDDIGIDHSCTLTHSGRASLLAEASGSQRIAKNPSLLQRVAEPFVTDATHRGSGLDATSIEISFDRILQVRRRSFAAHVYNLQTNVGWYVANNIITHNCKCEFGRAIDGARLLR